MTIFEKIVPGLRPKALATQCRQLTPAFFLVLLFCAAIILLAWFLHEHTGTELSELSRDPSAVTGTPMFIGFISNLGVMAWVACGAVCLLGFLAVRVLVTGAPAIQLLYAGLLSLFLAADDLFLFHENILPYHLHIPEKLVYLIYLSAIVLYLTLLVRPIMEGEFLLLFLALTFLGLSVIMDMILPFGDIVTFWEDIAKFMGILFWLIYHWRQALKVIKISQKGVVCENSA